MTRLFNQGAWTHPALKLRHGLSCDILDTVFDWLFMHHVFDRWCREEVGWQVHCVGGPGSGKTTLTSLVAKRLKEDSRAKGFPVISVFIQHKVSDFETEFLEDFLHVLYQELGQWEACDEDFEGDDYSKYVQARYMSKEGTRVHSRISLLRKALYGRLQSREKGSRIFLLLDGIDCCSPTLRLLLDSELAELQANHVSILITSRIPIFESVETSCDHTNHGDMPDDDPIDAEDREILDMYLFCMKCESILCFPCKEAGRICEKCKTNDHLCEDYDHVNIRMDTPNDAMESFIAWTMEREHGDLGLGSSIEEMPPPSQLGLAIGEDKNPNCAREIAWDIQRLALGHIGIAKARLDLIHEALSVEEISKRGNQLPANIVALFNAALEGIEIQSPQNRDLGLKAIAAASRDNIGESIPRLQQLLSRSIPVEPRSGEDMLEATNGFLVTTANFMPYGPQMLRAFHDHFSQYVKDRFRESLYHAKLELDRDNLTKKRSTIPHPLTVGDRNVRFEPQTISEEPGEITPRRLGRTATSLLSEEEPRRTFIIRKGTVAWS